jgi:mycoredoxin
MSPRHLLTIRFAILPQATDGRGKPAGDPGVASELVWEGRETRVSEPLVMYTTPWCGYCRRLKSQLAREGIEVTEVDIERDPAAADYVMSVNGGSQTVPTVVLPDGTALTNPSAARIREYLRELTTG